MPSVVFPGEPPERRPTLADMADHIDQCPIGWVGDNLVLSRSTTEADIVAWVKRLMYLRDQL